MQPAEFTVFETQLGWIALAWRENVVVRLTLPGHDRDATRRGLLRNGLSAVEAEPSFAIRQVIQDVARYAAGERVDFSPVPVLLEPVDPLRSAIYAALRQIGYGQTLTYGELAERAGYPGQAREIGQAMGRNPVPLIVPCHRVLAAGGRPGGFSAPGGTATKLRMLALEGVRLGRVDPAQAAFAF